MKKLAEKIIKHRFIITPIFLLLAVFTFTLMDDVNTNYDNSKYLPEESLATKDTNAIRESIDFPLSLSLMVSNIEKTDVASIKAKIETIANVEFVIIDSEDISNFKDGNGLFTVFLKSDTEDIGVVVKDIESTLSAYEINMSGNHVNTYHQEQKVLEETPIIMIVACLVIAAILLLTTQRYLEPLAFGVVIGIAIILNMGTNIIFPEISYVTKSVAAVLQLGLSMDYSIILINNYYHEKKTTSDSKKAMTKALSNSFKPITSSSLTTVIGLVALLFMSFTIGKDIGLVLAKGIVISLISVFTLLPNFILWLEKVPFNKKHKTLNTSRLSVRSNSKKISGGITAFAFIFILVMFYIQGQNSYIFTDETKFEEEEAIKAVFGDSNTFVIGIPNNEDLYENEDALMTKLNEKYKSSIISYLGEVNSSKKQITYQDLTSLTTENKAKLMLSLYALDNNTSHEMTYNEFIIELEQLVNSGALEITPEMQDLNQVILIKNIIDKEFSATELLESGLLPNTATAEMINLVYNSYAFDSGNVATSKLSLNQVIATMLYVANENPSLITDQEELANLQTLKTQLDNLSVLLASDVSIQEFQALAASSFGITLETETVQGLYASYFAVNAIEPTTKVAMHNLLSFIVEHQVLPQEHLQMIQGVLSADLLAKTPQEFTEVNQTLNTVVYLLTGTQGSSELSSSLVKFNYIIALDQAGAISRSNMNLSTLIQYLEALSQDPLIGSMLSSDVKTSMEMLKGQINLLESAQKYSHTQISSMLSTTENPDLDKLCNVLYSSSLSRTQFMETYKVTVEDVLAYVLTEDLGLEAAELEQILMLQNELNTMKNIISADNISLIVLNTTLPYESKETRDFIDYIYNDVFSTIDEDAQFIGYSVSDAEIKGYFEDDLLKINFITIGAVLLILIVTFQSIIIPILLVFTIEGAIWTTLSYSYVINEDIFFMCYIIIGAIQLGATIDYAIILTSNYQAQRKIDEPKTALKIAMHKSIPSILTSGSILTIAGFAIAFVSTQASIVSIGSFLGRGTLISMIYVVTILPSMLFAFDKLIIKKKHQKA